MAYGPEVMEEAFAESRILQKSSYARLLATTTLLGTCSPNRLVTRPPSFAVASSVRLHGKRSSCLHQIGTFAS